MKTHLQRGAARRLVKCLVGLSWLGVMLAVLCLFPQRLIAQLTPPGGGWTFPTNLNAWTFADVTNWTSDNGYAPLSFTNIIGLQYRGDMSTKYALQLDTTNTTPAFLHYNLIETNATNLTLDVGSITFWLSPASWASASLTNGTGPGVWAELLSVGQWTTNASFGYWGLSMDPGGTNIYFASQTNNGTAVTYLSVPIAWSTNEWHFIGLTYSSSNSALYLDGKLAATGSNVTIFPAPNALTNGFFIGSGPTGFSQSRALFDDIYTFGNALSDTDMENIYNEEYFDIFLNPNNPSPHIVSAPSSSTNGPIFNAVTGSGFLTAISTNTSGCVTSSNVWITNFTAAVVGTNMSITFTIGGGSNGVPYDVFANSVLDFSNTTNAPWAWMGQGYQCVTYTITNLPMSSCFLILGSPVDQDADGLTDAYERLVSKTDPTNPNSSGDGMLDGWKVLWGMSPLINNSAQPNERNNYIYDGTSRLESLSGIENEGFGFDNEGNIQIDLP